MDLERQQLLARVDLHLALGGGFEMVEVPAMEGEPTEADATHMKNQTQGNTEQAQVQR